ncbi:MAG: hypothetical protein NTX12_04215 [Actinobacteria bacterium]|nr:hypothetical protein [Actinomycetota bacterium]
MRALKIFFLLLIFTMVTPAYAHQPVFLLDTDTRAANGPLLVDGTVSFAVRISFSKSGQARAFRAGFQQGDQLSLQYLIVDKKPESVLRSSQLPVVTIVSPSGQKITLKITERTKFYEPFGRTNYLYLSRYNGAAEAGIYSIVITSRAKSSITIAIGEREVQGQVERK